MESLFSTFKIGFLLRSLFSGIFFVISFYAASHTRHEIQKPDHLPSLSVVFSAALFGGVFVYGLHRSLIYPLFIEWLFDSECGKNCRKCCPLILPSTRKTCLWRWQREDQLNRKQINERFDTWADYIHLQYTSVICIVFGTLVGGYVTQGRMLPCWPLIIIAIVLTIAALVSDWRLRAVLDHAKEIIQPQNEFVCSACMI